MCHWLLLKTKTSDEMTAEEEKACRCLKKPGKQDAKISFTQVLDELSTSPDKKRKASQISDNEGPYYPCDFILGSAAEVERLWSSARYIMSDQRSRLAQELLEAILVLRFNSEIWEGDKYLVAKAVQQVRKETAVIRQKQKERVEAVMEVEELEDSDCD